MSSLVEATRRLAAVEAGEVHEPLVVLAEAAGGRVPHAVVVPQPHLAPLPPVRVHKLLGDRSLPLKSKASNRSKTEEEK